VKYRQQVSGVTYTFDGLIEVMAKATPLRSGDQLAGCAAEHDGERAAAAWVLADLPLEVFLNEELVPYDTDEVTRLIMDTHDRQAFRRCHTSPWVASGTGCSMWRPRTTVPGGWLPSHRD
jgi:ethanolamine ammonia-lyase large subunit